MALPATVFAAMASVPRDRDGPVFRQPWEAQAFALVVTLHEAGLFTWSEWADALATQIARAQAHGDPDRGETFYLHWLSALEALASRLGLTDPRELEERLAAWERAARATPHGQPITLSATGGA